MKRDQRCSSGLRAAAAREVRDRDGRDLDREPAPLLQSEAEIGIFPIQKELLIHAADRFERGAPDHHAGARDPVDLNRIAQDFSGDTRLRRVQGFFGQTRLSQLVRPANPVVTPGKRLADACTDPSGSRTSGPTMPTVACSSSHAARVCATSSSTTQSGFKRRKYAASRGAGSRDSRPPRIPDYPSRPATESTGISGAGGPLRLGRSRDRQQSLRDRRHGSAAATRGRRRAPRTPDS